MQNKILIAIRNNLRRIFAKIIDGIIVYLLIGFLSPIGAILAIVYTLICDTLFNGQSIGKKLLDLRVVSTIRKDKKPTLFESALRNSPFVAILILLSLPLLGWILFFTVGIIIIELEAYLILTQEQGQRIGDILAHTKVISSKK